jgi:LPXTG-motif cell wall-anchored protein
VDGAGAGGTGLPGGDASGSGAYPGYLPHTGASIAVVAAAAAALVLLGGGALWLARRRHAG